MKHRVLKYAIITAMLVVETILSSGLLQILSVLEIPIGILLVIYIPGALAVEAFFPTRHLQMIERVALSLAVSAVLILTIPFAMSSFGIIFDRLNLSYAVDIVVFVLMIASAWRLRRTSVPEYTKQGLWTSLFMGIAGVVLLAAVGGVVAHNQHNQQPSFYVTGPSGKLSSYPFEVVEKKRYSLELHISNPTREGFQGEITETNSEHRVLLQKMVAVKGAASWSDRFILPSNGPIRDETITFRLKVGQHPNWSRTLWVRYHIVLQANKP